MISSAREEMYTLVYDLQVKEMEKRNNDISSPFISMDIVFIGHVWQIKNDDFTRTLSTALEQHFLAHMKKIVEGVYKGLSILI